MTPAPQKKMDFPEGTSSEQIAGQFKNMMFQGLQSSKINPMIFVQLGDMAKKTISQKELYPMLKKAAIDNKIMTEQSFGEGIDYKVISLLVAMGKTAQEYMTQNQIKPT